MSKIYDGVKKVGNAAVGAVRGVVTTAGTAAVNAVGGAVGLAVGAKLVGDKSQHPKVDSVTGGAAQPASGAGGMVPASFGVADPAASLIDYPDNFDVPDANPVDSGSLGVDSDSGSFDAGA